MSQNNILKKTGVEEPDSLNRLFQRDGALSMQKTTP